MEIDSSTLHPNPVPNTQHRKIELQSSLDLTYLQSNLAASARQKLDLHFPPSASQPQPYIPSTSQPNSSSTQQNGTTADPMRQRVQDLVSQFLDRTWTGAKQSISINGQDATTLPPSSSSIATTTTTITTGDSTGGIGQPTEEREGIDFEYEPYDPRLSRQVASLYGELEALTTQVSKLRRTAPVTAAQNYNRALLAALEEDQRAFEASKQESVEKGGRQGELTLDEMRDGWQEDVEKVHELGMSELRRLGGHGGSGSGGDERSGGRGGSLTETVGKVQRAKVVAIELE